MATHLQLRQRVSRRLDQALVATNKGAATVDDIPLTGVFWTRQMVTDWLNEAHLQIWSELAEVDGKAVSVRTDGTYTANAISVSLQTLLGVTADPLEILDVRDVTGNTTGLGFVIPFIPWSEIDMFRRTIEPLATSGRITARGWTYAGHDPMGIELIPVPSSNVTLRLRWVRGEPVNPTSGTAPALRADTANNATGDADVPVGIPAAHHDLLVMHAVVQAKQREESDWRPEWELLQERLARFRESAEERQQQGGRRTRVVDAGEYDFGASRRMLGPW